MAIGADGATGATVVLTYNGPSMAPTPSSTAFVGDPVSINEGVDGSEVTLSPHP